MPLSLIDYTQEDSIRVLVAILVAHHYTRMYGVQRVSIHFKNADYAMKYFSFD